MSPKKQRASRAVVLLAAASLAGCATHSAPPDTPAAQASRAPNTTTPVATASTDNRQTTASSDTAETSAWRDRGWVLVAVGSGAGVVAIGTGLLLLSNLNIRGNNCNDQKICNQDGYNANTQINNLGVVNATAFGVAAVGIGLGAFLVLTHPKTGKATTTEERKKEPAAPSAALGVAPTGSGVGFNLKGSF